MYDVVIVGGRAAGSSLAAQLGKRGQSVLVLDRATFPSLPTVPSSPMLHSGAMQLLDELGIDERAYGIETDRILYANITLEGSFVSRFKMPVAHGRDYIYGVKRDRFDYMLWQHLDRYPSVHKREGFVVTKLTQGRVSGRDRDGHEHTFEAPWIIGADGRYSTIAKLAGARTVLQRDQHTSTAYYADWVGLSGPCELQVITDGRGSDVLMIPGPDGTTSVNTHQRSDIVDIGDDVEAYYERTLMSFASVRDKLKGAKRVDRIVGIKRISNRFLEAGGPGWLLIGDAWHHKDPVDGQGIYDALLEAKILAQVLEEKPRDVVAEYERRARAATEPMFHETVKRLKRELYGKINPISRQLMRWLTSDPVYQDRFIRVLSRALPCKDWLSPGLLLGAVVRGIRRDLRR